MADVTSNDGGDEFLMPILTQKAHQACLTCKRQKRKCDKELPSCGLCLRMARPCDYSDPPPLPSYDDINILHSRIHDLETQLHLALAVHAPQAQPGAAISNIAESHSIAEISQNGGQLHEDMTWSNIKNRFPSIAFLDSEAFQVGGHV